MPFAFQDDLLREGMRARLQCVLTDGDPKMEIKWTKDGRPISESLGIVIRKLDDFSSTLMIPIITPRHNGNYTCTATNAARSSQHTAVLNVNGNYSRIIASVFSLPVPPKIIPFNFLD